jgi:hypothetical protein
MIFGEDLTLARVSIDASGVVRGVATQKAALAGGEADIRSFGRTAEAATGLAIGGFVLAAAAVGTATYTIAKHSDAWKGFDEAAKKANHSILNLIGDLSGINSGLESATGWLARFGKIADNLKGESLAAGEGGGGYITAALTGTLGWYGLFQKLEAVGKWMDKRLGTNQAGVYGPPSHANTIEGMDLPPSTWPGPASSPLGPAAPPFAQLVGAVQAVKLDVPPNLADPVREYANAITQATDAFSRFREVHGFGPGGEGTGEGQVPDLWLQEAGGIEDVTGKFFELRDAVYEAGRAYEDFGTLATAAMEATSAAAAAGVISASAAARVQEVILAANAIMKGKIELAAAVASAALHDHRGATLHGVAAGLYFAAAGFHGAAAVHPASYGFSGGSDRGDPNQMALAQQGSPGAPTVNVYVQGSLMGTSPEQLSREIVTLWQKGARDMGGTSVVIKDRR